MFYLSVRPNFVNNQTSFDKCQVNFSTFHERFEPWRIFRSDDVAVGEKINVHSDWLLLARENSSNNQSQRASLSFKKKSLEQRKKNQRFRKRILTVLKPMFSPLSPNKSRTTSSTFVALASCCSRKFMVSPRYIGISYCTYTCVFWTWPEVTDTVMWQSSWKCAEAYSLCTIRTVAPQTRGWECRASCTDHNRSCSWLLMEDNRWPRWSAWTGAFCTNRL